MRLGAKLLCAVALPANRIKAIKAGVLGTPSARAMAAFTGTAGPNALYSSHVPAAL